MRSGKNRTSIFFMLLLICLCAGAFSRPIRTEAATKKAKVVLEFTDGTKETWRTGDEAISLNGRTLAYIYFGSYPQSEVTGKKLKKSIKNAEYDENGVATVKSVKYKRISWDDALCGINPEYYYDLSGFYDWNGKEYAYFKYEPIKWRVLDYSKSTAVLLSEYGLDAHAFHEEPDGRESHEDVYMSWEHCTLRQWLNGSFINTAFNAKERKLIKKVQNGNEDYYTTDKISLLSNVDLRSSNYGFDENLSGSDLNRRCSATDYANAHGVYVEKKEREWYGKHYLTAEGNVTCQWWIRYDAVGEYRHLPIYIEGDGGFGIGGYTVGGKSLAIRPTLQLNMKSILTE